MLIEILFKNIMTSVVVDTKNYQSYLESSLPFSSRASVWKQEVYFPTPVDIPYRSSELLHKVNSGSVYYWPPEKALCLFYGITQSYTPVVYIGEMVDPVQVLLGVEDGYDVEVDRHTIDKRYSGVTNILRKLGYSVATPLRNGERVVVAQKRTNNKRYSFTVFVEDYGIHVESEGIVKYRNDDLRTFVELIKLRNAITGYARLDLSEEGLVVLTATVADETELENAIRDLESNIDRLPYYNPDIVQT